jgi:hypothetical protein
MANPQYMDEFVSANFIPHTDIERFPSVPAPALDEARAREDSGTAS